jgi:hypothetical protein
MNVRDFFHGYNGSGWEHEITSEHLVMRIRTMEFYLKFRILLQGEMFN